MPKRWCRKTLTRPDDGGGLDKPSYSVVHNNNNISSSKDDKEDVEPVWSIKYLDGELGSGGGHPRSKRRKISAEDEEEDVKVMARKLCYTLDRSPFRLPDGALKSGSLDRWYKVLPAEWENVPQYLSFEWLDVKHSVGDFVDVQGERMRYIGRIVEIRASDPQHVSLLVSWMYFPQELPEVRQLDGKRVRAKQPYHGQRELVASNHMDVIPAYSVNASVKVVQWREEEECFDINEWGTYYWRQAYDLKTQELSAVTPRCACKMPENPDLKLVQCGNKNCAEWLHEECIEKDARQKAAAAADICKSSSPQDTQQTVQIPGDSDPQTLSRKKPKKRKRRTPHDGAAHLQGDVVITTTLEIPDDDEDSPKIVLRSYKRGSLQVERKWKMPVHCLICGEEINRQSRTECTYIPLTASPRKYRKEAFATGLIENFPIGSGQVVASF